MVVRTVNRRASVCGDWQCKPFDLSDTQVQLTLTSLLNVARLTLSGLVTIHAAQAEITLPSYQFPARDASDRTFQIAN